MPPKKFQPHATLPTNVGKKRTLEEQPSEDMINNAKVQKIQDGPVPFKQKNISEDYQDYQEVALRISVINVDQKSGQLNQVIENALKPEELKEQADNNEDQQEGQGKNNNGDSSDSQSQEKERDTEMIDTTSKNPCSLNRKAANKFQKKLKKLEKDQRMLDNKLGPDSFLEYQEEDEDNEELNPGAAAYEDAEQQSKGFLFSIEKITKRKGKNGAFPSEVTKQLIDIVSDKFRRDYSQLNLKTHEHFKYWHDDEFEKLKYWYKNLQKKFRKEALKKKIVIPNIENPNQVLMNLLSLFDEEHVKWIASMIEKVFPQELLSHYVNKALDQILNEIDNCANDINSLVELLGTVPKEIRLKATARAIRLLQEKGLYSDDHRRSWFNNCIKPSLAAVNKFDYLEFSDDDVKIIKELCDFNGLQHLEDLQGIAYLRLLETKKMLDLDEVYRHFLNKGSQFWLDVLTQVCKIQLDIADILVQNKSTMITSSILYHCRISGINTNFAEVLSYFDKMSKDEITLMYQLKEERNFELLLACLDKNQKHKFSMFQRQSQIYMNIDDESQVQCCELLQCTPLDQWTQYYNQIIASSSFLKEDDSLTKVQQAIEEARDTNNLMYFEEKEIQKTCGQWDKVFKALTKDKRFRELKWQKEVVVYLANLLAGTKANSKIIVTLGTGHGKSLLIQLLADILIENRQKVIIVCLNDFLASQGRRRYGSPNVVHGKLEYISLTQFLKRQPESLTNVIFDEIDSMLGTDSFSLINNEETKITTAFYNASQMLQWKSIVGFSGTISQSTITQIRLEFDKAICINIPSLRIKGGSNTVAQVIKIDDNGDAAKLYDAVAERINELKKKTDCVNYIVIFENLQHLNSFKTSAYYLKAGQDKNCVIFDNFNSNFSQIEKKLNDVAKDNFLILTTKEGARGVDYKGQHVAHVIMAYKPRSLSECIQALGRGCRSLTGSTEGTIICSDPITEDGPSYLDLLESADDELSQSFRLNSKIARMLHGQSVATNIVEKEADELKQPFNNEPHETFYWFQQIMKRGDNFLNDNENLVVWRALKKFNKSGKMPDDPNHRWNE